MNEKNFDWNDLRFFLAVARNKGLSGAARDTGSSAPTLGRRMHALEKATGKEIFHRHARGYDLTEQGEAFFSKAMELEANVIPLLSTKDKAGKTLVKISAGQWTSHALSQNIHQITEAAPDALLRFISTDEYLNINHRETVIGIRNQRPEQLGLACRKVGTVSFAGYATDPSVEGWIRVTSNTPSAKWLASLSDVNTVMEVNSSQLAKQLALKGVGRVVLPCFIGDRVQGLSKVHAVIPELDHEQWLVSHEQDRFISAVRQVLKATYDVLKQVIRTDEHRLSQAFVNGD
ncbi:MAG: LysR family transcriptional regulator [Paracoccaceae bacterium]